MDQETIEKILGLLGSIIYKTRKDTIENILDELIDMGTYSHMSNENRDKYEKKAKYMYSNAASGEQRTIREIIRRQYPEIVQALENYIV